MPFSSDGAYPESLEHQLLAVNEHGIEDAFIEKLRSLKYTHRPDIHDHATLKQNFREKFEALNHVRLTDGEFAQMSCSYKTAWFLLHRLRRAMVSPDRSPCAVPAFGSGAHLPVVDGFRAH